MSQYTLPVSKGERLLWTHEIPQAIKCTDDDYVSFHAVGGEIASYHCSGEGNPNFPNAACYAAVMPHYNRFKITCYPKSSGQWLSLEQVQEFYGILAAHAIVPHGIEFWEQNDKDWKGVLCRLGKKLGNPHLYYTALTCYRWIDCHAPLVWEFLQIMGDGTPRHPLQVLPYLTNKWSIDSGHNFVADYDGGESNSVTNPLLGLAGKIYFDRDDPRGRGLYKSPYQPVNTSIQTVNQELTTVLAVPGKSSWNKNHMVKIAKYVLNRPIDALHPGLYELYTIPNITDGQIESILAKLFTKKVKP